MQELSNITGATPEERLEAVGVDNIINMIGNGVRLRTHGNRKDLGLLNHIDVTEQQFVRWMSGQEMQVQFAYSQAMNIAGANLTTDIIHQELDILSEIDEILDRDTQRPATKRDLFLLAVLEKKHKIANDLLKNLSVLQKMKFESEKNQPNEIPTTPQQSAPTATVTVTEEQKAMIEKLK